MPGPSKRLQTAAEKIRQAALAYPETHEDFPWEHSAFKVRKKVFLFMALNDDFLSMSMKLPHSGLDVLALPFTEPTGYGMGKHGWVSAKFATSDRPPLALIKEWMDESYRAIAPKTVVKKMDAS